MSIGWLISTFLLRIIFFFKNFNVTVKVQRLYTLQALILHFTT